MSPRTWIRQIINESKKVQGDESRNVGKKNNESEEVHGDEFMNVKDKNNENSDLGKVYASSAPELS